MNGKQAKRLRRKAKAGTVRQPDRIYSCKSDGSCVLGFCTRGVYQQLKSLYKKQKG